MRWKDQARMQQLVQISSGSAQPFDWTAFHKQQEMLEARASAAASLLMSPSLQQRPVAKLLVNADPSLARQIQAAQSLAGNNNKGAVGGMGTWTETHDPTKPPQDQAGWEIPKGLPFGGNIASRPLNTAAAKRRALQRQLQRVEKLMNKQWGKSGGGMERELGASAERR